MPDQEKLKTATIDELRDELSSRQADKSRSAKDRALRLPGSAKLTEFDSPTLVSELKRKQRVVYGEDNRQDRYDVADPALLSDGDSVVALFRAENIIDNGDQSSTLKTESYKVAYELCSNEPFVNQPIGAFCTGFLVAPDIVATAGHCVNDGNVTATRFVFGFSMKDNNSPQTKIPNTEIYSGKEILGRELIENGPDWALVRLNRAVANHRVAPIRRSGSIANNQSVHVIGHPCGLPVKYAAGAKVRDNLPTAFFVANLDTFGGNSGSPVFNSVTHEVEGILVRGEQDFTLAGNCNVSLVCPVGGCRGEDVTRTTEFADKVPPSAPAC